ncbi:FMN adenylyltransferase / Riboflavin kinase [Candidatus Xenohaliotis californiensis]|uniref:Riboflavin biosynthesis protein n=1 Tax=Candidatus Xenohaliotis californiensis TaxID=84677 RepID=A0ABM9N8H0_9RICK|nr:FMN adenylyltransferase / Riboflavin kinase [Candidatus Xenohaliotis californiensis]
MFKLLEPIAEKSRPILAIGNFDGVHLGHQKLLHTTVKIAKQYKQPAVALIFYPHPKATLLNIKNELYINNIRIRIKKIINIGIKSIYIIRPNHKILSTTPISFINKVLINQIKTLQIVVGENFYFGHNRTGNTKLLSKELHKYNVRVNIVPLYQVNNKTCSSTIIKQMIKKGCIKIAEKMLGDSYTIGGRIIKGAQKARTIGFPTANINIENIVHPPFGVYAAEISINNAIYLPAVVNIGIRPTMCNNKNPLLEAHILDFNQNIYGAFCIVKIKNFIRAEQKFQSLYQLTQQIKLDVEKIRQQS